MALARTGIGRQPHSFVDKQNRTLRIVLFEDRMIEPVVRMMFSLERGLASGLPPHRDEECLKWIEEVLRTGIHLVAIDPMGVPLGQAILFPIDGSTCELMAVVTQSHRNLGLGTQLTRQAMILARDLGFSRIWLSLGMGNRVARHVYQSCGFKAITSGDAEELEMVAEL
jgi:GNAT superfamily N-acetyltransferase